MCIRGGVTMILYHGSDTAIDKPVSGRGRTDVDFGVGFYLTEDKRMAQKWACNKTESILNVYDADLSQLNTKKLKADGEWLDYVIYNRTHEGEKPFDDTDYDVIIGPTADDKLFATIDLYTDGIITKEQTIEVVNCMNYSDQVVFKNDAAIRKALVFREAKELKGFEKQELFNKMVEDRKQASKRANELIRQRR